MDMEGLSIICAGLGMVEEDENGNRIGYTKGAYCLDNLKDLLRFLRRDDPQNREVFKQVCKWNTVGKDLIPIIEHCPDDRNLVLNAVKVLVFLTMPVEATSNDIAQQVEYLWELKSSVTYSDTVAVTVSLLESPLENLEREAFTEDDWKLVQLVLTLYRNILAIQDISMLQKAGEFTTHYLSLRDRFLELLFHENVMDLILVLTQHIDGSCGFIDQDNLLLLEAFHYTFLGQEPELLAKAFLKDSKVDADRASVNSLRSIMQEEEEKRKLVRQRNLGVYSQFSGTFTRMTMDGSKTLLKGNPCASSDTLLKPHQSHRGPLKRMVWDHGKLPSTKDNLLESLHNFVNQFLSGGYNVLMQSIHEDIEKEHHAIQNSDVVIFFQVAQFVTSFQYHKFLISKPTMETDTFHASVDHHADGTVFEGNICGPIAASMNESMFLLVFSKWRNAFEGLKETNDHKFLSTAGSLMKIMIRMLDLMLKLSPEDSREPQTARIILYKLFYDQTDQGMTQFLLNLIKSFDTHKQAKGDLVDLLETIHVVIRLMENLQERGTLRVSKKKRKKRTKKTVHDKNENVDKQVGDDVTAHNETDIPECEQSIDLGMSGNKKSTHPSFNGKGEDIVSVLADELKASDLEMANLVSNLAEMKKGQSDRTNDGTGYGTGDSSADELLTVTDEVDFKVSTLVSALANNTIIKNVCWLLKFYKSNSTGTNHHIVSMLRRICDDLELSPMLYQLSLLTTFYSILDEQKSCPCKEYENIVVFLTSFVRRMLRKMKNQPLLFVEILFWKTRRECHYINCESWLHEMGDLKKESRKWGSLSKDGEAGPSQGWVRRNIADALGDDEADFVISDHMDKQKEDPSEANDERLMQNGNEITGEVSEHITTDHYSKDLKGSSSLRRSLHTRKRVRAFNEDQETMIKALFEQFKDHKRCSYMIANALDAEGTFTTAQVSRKIKQLGLRVPQQKKPKADIHLKDDNTSTEGADDSDDETLLSMRKRNKTKQNIKESEKRSNQKINGKLSPYNSDDEVLSSLLGDQPKSTEMEAAEIGDSSFVQVDDAEKTDIGSGKQSSVAHVNDLQHQQLHDELADFVDEVATVESHKSAGLRRKFRIDLEDDE